jgi:hypothetical protein
MSSIGKDLPAPEGRSALKLQALLARFQATKQEIQWRGVQRDALVVLALTFTVGIYVGIDKIGAWVMLAPVPLLYVASMWLHHDRRIGFLAGYILNVVEPALKDYDDLEGLDEYLNDKDPARSFARRLHFSEIVGRLVFPGLQLAALASGVGIYIAKGSFTPLTVWFVAMGSVLMLVVIWLTFSKVKHIRQR